jgi:steroid delta-isomerase-like uncharacterized protein
VAVSADENKARFLQYFDRIFNRCDPDATAEAFAPDIVFHAPIRPEAMRGPGEVQQWAARLRAGFPDLHITIEDLLAEGDTVMARWSWTGTHRGEFEGIPPTGRRVSARALEIYRFVDGRVQEVWLELDPMHLLRQLGVMPPLESVPRPAIWLMSRLSRRRADAAARVAP